MVFSAYTLNAQINRSHNGLRIGDELIKQQVEYKEPGEPGKNKVWDFSQLTTINDAYTLTYSLPPIQGDSLYIMGACHFNVKQTEKDELIVGTEHNTMYYYRQGNDSLILLGHENPSVMLSYTKPVADMVYPLNYGQSIIKDYESKGLYSATVDIHTKGTVQISADAFGKMILPTGDTLNPVLRIKTTRLILDLSDSTSVNTTTQLESYKWYTKGYRYPIFETVRNISLADSTELFSTAFFFPPQDHYYLDTDPENLAILDSLWNIEEGKLKSIINDPVDFLDNANQTYRIYPNPVQSTLYIDYTLREDYPVTIQLRSLNGALIRTIDYKNQRQGTYTEKIDCMGLPVGVYILKITKGNETVTEKIIKK